MTEPCDLSALEARRLIGRKALSPVELLESCLKRIDEVNPAVNAMVARDDAAARSAAREAEAAVMQGEHLGALHGLPVGIKDLYDARGLKRRSRTCAMRVVRREASSSATRRTSPCAS